MSTLSRLAIVLALGGCYDGRALQSDAPVEADARDRGAVRVKVTGFIEKAGLRVYFQDRDSTLSLATQTDANGEVTGRVGPDGFVTLVWGQDFALSMWTYTGVQPGDELEFYDPDVVHVPTPMDSLSVFAPDAGEPPFILRSSCGGAHQIFDALPVAVVVSLCGPRADYMLEKGQFYRYERDVDLTASQRRVDFDGELAEYALSTVTVTGVTGQFGVVSQALLGRDFPLVTTTSAASTIDGEVRVNLGLPLPAGATMLTEIDLEGATTHNIVDWRPAQTSLEVAYGDVTLADAIEPPRFDASTHTIAWSEGPGTHGDLVRATLFWLDSEHARNRNWTVIGPRGEEAALRLPVLPQPDLVPVVETPQTMESFLVGDQLGWYRQHLHGRWLPQGNVWPARGAAGRIYWQSL